MTQIWSTVLRFDYMNEDADRSVFIVTRLLLAPMNHCDSDRDSGKLCYRGAFSV